MAYLAQQDFVAELVGVDGIQKALDTFAQEHGEFEIQPAGKIGDYDRLTGQKITLLKGDYFNLDDSATNGRFGAVFDRASMVAIQPSLRVDYVQTMSKLLAPGGRILLAVIERNSGTEDDKKGPPFSVPEAEVRRLYEGQEWVESVVLLEQGGEKERNEGTSWLS
jgi:thiopurine S-methyltransferase